MSLIVEFHTELQVRLLRWVAVPGTILLTEYRLPNGKVADVITLTDAGLVTIYEIKTLLHPSLITVATDKYQHYCNQFYIAAPYEEVNQMVANTGTYEWERRNPSVGYLAFTPGEVQPVIRPKRRILPRTVEDYIRTDIRRKSALLANHG